MSLTWGNAVKLSAAKLCSNCETVSDARGETCPACAAFANWLPLASLLGSTREQAEVINIQSKGAAA